MEKDERNVTPHYTKHDGMSIDMYPLDEAPTKKLLRGRALLNDEKREMTFVQNAPRGPRSVEVGRTLHRRYVCRPDGEYTVTVHFAADEGNIREQLLSEIRSMVTAVQDHFKNAEAKRKKEFLQAQKSAGEAIKRISASFDKVSDAMQKTMHKVLEGGEK